MFDVPFDEIAPIVERSPQAARQLASRARRRVRGADSSPVAEHARQREVVDAFLAAARDGDFETLVAVLDPHVVLRADRPAVIAGASTELRGAREVARRALEGGARTARAALVDGAVGVVVAPRGRLLMVLRFTFRDGKIVEIDAIADPARLRRLDLTVLED
jgi:RNA polymerase sigma-70 factor (ECF subfamily)